MIAFYLPQFHPVDENNKWWGPGFTEWSNVAKAKPLYPGHWQPHLPADLGFYDLRLAETREHQSMLARNAGVAGFCYWHYWFGNGRRLLERPFNEVLASGKPDFPFCLAWANEPWTGVWYGSPGKTLVDQLYPGPADVVAHFDAVLPAFRDRRYMTVDGKPIFVIFNPPHLGDTTSFISQWRSLAARAGLPGLHFVGMSRSEASPSLIPFDMLTEVAPGNYLNRLPSHVLARAVRRLKRHDFGGLLNRATRNRLRRPDRYSYGDLVEQFVKSEPAGERWVPCVMPNWDNTPRSHHRGIVFESSTPELFETMLAHAVEQIASRPAEQRIIFLKAWNEWAEGNYVEPDTRFGHGYLDSIRNVVLGGVPAHRTLDSQPRRHLEVRSS